MKVNLRTKRVRVTAQMSLDELPSLLSLGEAALVTGTCPNFWYQKIARGELSALRAGRSLRIRREDLLQLIGAAA